MLFGLLQKQLHCVLKMSRRDYCNFYILRLIVIAETTLASKHM